MSTATTNTPPAIAGDGFPTWLPPMLVRELRQGLRQRGFVAVFAAFQALMLLMMAGSLIGSSIRGTTVAFRSLDTFFWILLTAQLLFVTPMRALNGLRTELESRSMDLLLLTRLSPWRIVAGKWGSLLAQALLLLVAMLPYGVVRYFGGSVDLVHDGLACLALLGGSAVLTGLALWASGLPRGFQIVVPVAMVVMFQFVVMASRGSFSLSRLPLPWPLLCWNGALALGYFLVSAVRRIAPPSDNHAPLARLLALGPLLATPFGVLASVGMARAQLAFGLVFAAIVCVMELATTEQLMRVHVAAWGRHPLRSIAGRFLSPGWPSALLFTMITAAIAMGMTKWPGLLKTTARGDLGWVVVLALGAAVLPVALMPFLPWLPAKQRPVIYVIIFGLMGILAAFASATASGTWFEDGARLLPGSSFWLSMNARNPGVGVRLAQSGPVLVVVLAALYHSRPYWARWSDFARRRRDESA